MYYIYWDIYTARSPFLEMTCVNTAHEIFSSSAPQEYDQRESRAGGHWRKHVLISCFSLRQFPLTLNHYKAGLRCIATRELLHGATGWLAVWPSQQKTLTHYRCNVCWASIEPALGYCRVSVWLTIWAPVTTISFSIVFLNILILLSPHWSFLIRLSSRSDIVNSMGV